MDLKKILRFELFIGLIVIFFIVICYFKFGKNNKDIENNEISSQNDTNDTNDTNKTNETFSQNSNKVLHYYGGHGCPHSNKQSNMYKLLHEKFNDTHKNVQIIDYWGSEEKDREHFTKNNIRFVPTLLNSNGVVVKLKLPEGTNSDGKSEDEIEKMIFNHLVDQL
jgi:hypothetical protein